jgi:hypothetical protein
MGLYNAVFGYDDRAGLVLAALGLTPSDVGRFRDAGVAEGKCYVYTRNGGGNREHYSYDDPPVEEGPGCDCTGCVMTYSIPSLPYYVCDEDDEYDNTYATVWFDFPPEYADGLARLDSGEKWEPSERWTALIDGLLRTTTTAQQSSPKSESSGAARAGGGKEQT